MILWAWLLGCRLIRGTSPDELVELVQEGSEKVLREPMRPIQGGDRVLLVALDGVGDAALRQALAEGNLPTLARLIGRDRQGPAHGWIAPRTLSVLPSITMAAWASIYTGQPPGQTGVPGNEWFVREQDRFLAPAPVSLHGHEHTVRVYTDGLLNAAIAPPTVFEGLPGRVHVSLSPVYRGADLLTLPPPTAVGAVFGAVAQGIVGEESVSQALYARLDTLGTDTLLAAIDRHGLPDLQVAYFPGVDLYTHLAEPALEKQQDYLREVIDPALDRILGYYRRERALRRTWIIVTSDHGHVPVLSDDEHALDDEPRQAVEQAGFRLRPAELEVEGGDHQAVLAYAGAMAFVYLADRSRCPEPGQRCDWTAPPRPVEDVLPAAIALAGALEPVLELVLVRVPAPDDPAPRYPADDRPLSVLTPEGRLVALEAYLREDPRPELLDLAARIDDLTRGPFGSRAGDIVLLSRSGMDRPAAERYYFSEKYRSWHGSPHAQDSLVPLLVIRRGLSRAELAERLAPWTGRDLQQTDVAEMVREMLSAEGGG